MSRPYQFFAVALAVHSCFLTLSGEPLQARLPNGRLITPLGDWVALAPYPFSLAVRPDGRQLAIPCIGYPFSLNIVDAPGTPSRHVTQIPNSVKSDPEVAVHAGVAYAPDGATIYDATGDSGDVDVLSAATLKRQRRFSINGSISGTRYTNSFTSSLALSQDGRTLFVVDQGNWRIVIVDSASGNRLASVPTGSNPLAIALSPDGRRLHVTNSGLFEYQVVDGVHEDDYMKTGLHFPAFGFPSKAARTGAKVEGHRVPGLGKENDVRGSSLWTYDIANPSKPVILSKLRLGETIRETKDGAIGGASPSGVIADTDHVYVTLAHQDTVVVASADGKVIQREIPLTPFTGPGFLDAEKRPLRGVMPAGLAQNSKQLFVTEAGINAIAVIDKLSGKVLGHLPAGWYPSAASLSPDGKTLYVVNTKGKGTGPNGGSALPPGSMRHYIGDLQFGSLLSIPLAYSEKELQMATARVLNNNQAALEEGGTVPHLKHAFLIIRENRTFDEIFGDLPGVNGDPSLARYGNQGWTTEEPELKNVRVTPNGHRIALRFATSDNFYTDSDVSADGHRWVVGAAPTPWMNMAWTSGYPGRRKGNPFSPARGRRALGGGADAPMPEDEPEFGTLWEHISGAGLSIRNYGEGLEVEGALERDGLEPEGHRVVLNTPVPKPVFLSTDRAYPTFNMGIPDQFRYHEFASDFGELIAKGPAPALTVIRLPNDHTAKPRPEDGYPYRASYVADNDLALGKIVDFLSHSSIWKDSAIFVIEDDPQGGADHVDAHRSTLLVIGPYVRSGYISHRHASMPSVQKTIYQMLGVGSLNLEDALAADLGDMFSAQPDLRPYVAQAADARIFEPAKAKPAHPKNAAEVRALTEVDVAATIRSDFQQKDSKRTKPSK